jgi:hypothetical protein
VPRYAVTDKNGKVVNHIIVADPLPKGYWPGYGAYLLPLEPVSTSKGGAALDVITFTKIDIPKIGDTIDLTTGVVTKFVPTQFVQDSVTVSSAPKQVFVVDEAPKDEGTITAKVGPK